VAQQRILNVRYEIPECRQLSAGCIDLLGRIFVTEPAQRITIAEILRHPWFKMDLPEGVAEMNSRLIPTSPDALELPPEVQVRNFSEWRNEQ
jgi:serine/threonine protein kinase